MALKEMSTVINCEREALELDSVPEFMRDNQLPTREAAVSMSSKFFSEREHSHDVVSDVEEPKSDELEALWPGVHHDFAPAPRRSGSFYMTIGFMAGAAISLIAVFGYANVSQLVLANKPATGKNILVAGANKTSNTVQAAPQTVTAQDGSETLVPATPTYQVQPGDTLAVIALRSYKRVSPRLLDQICKANNMRNANVLSLGQKLSLPEYHSQPSQVAATSAAQVQ